MPPDPAEQPRCGGSPGKPGVMPKGEADDLGATRYLCPGCPDCAIVPAPRRGHYADLEVVEAILLSDPREYASSYDASPKRMAEAVRDIIDTFSPAVLAAAEATENPEQEEEQDVVLCERCGWERGTNDGCCSNTNVGDRGDV